MQTNKIVSKLNIYTIRFLAVLICLGISACNPENRHDNAVGVEHPEMDQGTGSGGRVGNGGSGVLCRSDDGKKIESIEIFDFYESRALDPRIEFEVPTSTVFSPSLEGAVETAKYVVESRIRNFDVALADYLTWRLDTFVDEAVLSKAPLPATQDIEPLRDATIKGCKPIQLAFTREPNLLSSKRFHFWKPAFEHPAFSQSNRAALILHELIYELTAIGGATTSVGTRALIRQIFSGQYTENFKNREQYFIFAKKAGMPWAGFNRLPVRLSGAEKFLFWEDQQTLKSGHILPGDRVRTPIGDLRVGCAVQFAKDGTALAFSYKMVDGDSYPEFFLTKPDGQSERYSTYPTIVSKSRSLDESSWNESYINNPCRSTIEYPVKISEELDSKFFEILDKVLPVEIENNFFKMKINIISRVEIEGDIVGGFPKNEENEHGEIEFTYLEADALRREKCLVDRLTLTDIHLKDCNIKLSPWSDSVLPIKSIRRFENTHYFNRSLTVDIGKELPTGAPWFTVRNNLKLKLKPGSEASFDTKGTLRAAFVLKSDAPICISGSNRKLPVNDPRGLALRFDEDGCVIDP